MSLQSPVPGFDSRRRLQAGVAVSSVHRHYRTLRRMLAVAVAKQRLLANPCDRVEPPRIPRREMAVLTWDEAVALAEAHPERYRALVYLAVDSGMRWSELIGLRRARVDVRPREVRVTEQLIRLEGGEWLRCEPNTASSIRSITVSPVTADILAEHLERYAQPRPDGLVITNSADKAIAASSFRHHHFAPALARPVSRVGAVRGSILLLGFVGIALGARQLP